MARQLTLIRHGDTGAGGRFVGSTDLPITETSRALLKQTGAALAEEQFGAIFCSPLLRCRQTLEAFEHHADVQFLDDLKEIDFGRWELLPFDEIAARWPEKVDQWSQWSEDFTFPEGERIGDFVDRIRRVKEHIDLSDEENVLVITHGGVIRHLICMYLGIELKNYLLFHVMPGMRCTLALHSKGGVLTSLNS